MSRAGIFGSAHVESGGGGGSLEYVGYKYTGTASSFDIGPASDDRYVIVGVFSQTTTGGAATVTVAGSTIPQLGYLADRNRLWIHGGLVPSGTSASIAVSLVAGSVRLVAVWVARGGLAPSGESAGFAANASTPLNVTLPTNPGDLAVAISGGWQSGANGYPVWTNLTERVHGSDLPGATQPGGAADGGPASGSTFVANVDWYTSSDVGVGRSLLLVGMRAA